MLKRQTTCMKTTTKKLKRFRSNILSNSGTSCFSKKVSRNAVSFGNNNFTHVRKSSESLALLSRLRFLIPDNHKLDVCHLWPTWTHMKQPPCSTTRHYTRRWWHSQHLVKNLLTQITPFTADLVNSYTNCHQSPRRTWPTMNESKNWRQKNPSQQQIWLIFFTIPTFATITPLTSHWILSFAQNVSLQPSSSSNAKW